MSKKGVNVSIRIADFENDVKKNTRSVGFGLLILFISLAISLLERNSIMLLFAFSVTIICMIGNVIYHLIVIQHAYFAAHIGGKKNG